MRLPPFEYLDPANLNEALDMLEARGPDCRILAGGTDLLVRMKQRLATPAFLMSLKAVHELDYIRLDNGMLKIGARTSLKTILASEKVRTHFPALVSAINSIGAPTIQHYTGTIGGNLCQDSRCLFYNQSAFFRSGKPPCHKAGGKCCYAREESDRCHATFQSDSATVLVALGASVTLTRADGSRTLPLADLYSGFGEAPLTLKPEELMTEIEIPLPVAGSGSACKRLAFRSAIDYPIVNAAVALETGKEKIAKARIVVGAVSRAPLVLAQPAKALKGKSLSDADALNEAAKQAMDLASAFVVNNVGATVEYRIQMISVMVRGALNDSILRIRNQCGLTE